MVAAVNGSSAFGEVARAVFGFAKDPDSEDGERLLSQAKNSTGPEDLALSYRIESRTVTTDSGQSAEVGRFVILGNSDRTVGDVLRQEPPTSKRLGERSMDILGVVLTSIEPVTPADVADKLGIDADTAGQYLRRLAKQGRVAKTARGTYTRTDSDT